MVIVEHPSEFQIKIPFNRHRTRIEVLVKQIDGSRFDWSKKVWKVPIQQIEKVKILQTKTNAEWIKMIQSQPEEIIPIAPMPELSLELISKMNIVNKTTGDLPREYQYQGVARGLELKRFINGDEQGLGKTVQSIMTIFAADIQGELSFPCIVVCPSSTKINWQREWEMWTDKKALVLNDKVKTTWHRFYELGMHDVFIVNYESMRKFFVTQYPKKLKSSMDIIMDDRINLFKSIIIDEIHRCKNPSTQQTKIALRLSRGKNYRIGLTGTMIPNKPAEAIPQLHIIGKMGDEKVFKSRYCDGGNGYSNLNELNSKLNKFCYFRREKKDVAKDLPDKQRQTILCDITNREEYQRAKNDFVKYLEDNNCTDEEITRKLRGEIMVRMGVLKQIAAKGKIKDVIEFIDDTLENGEKLIVFHNLNEIGNQIREKFPKAVSVNGGQSDLERQKAIDDFQKNPDIKLIVCNIKAAGVGITLTASSRVAFIEYPWTYSDCAQCEDRAHRIGQTNNVMCTYFLGENTIDEYMYKMIQEKRHIGNTVTGATDKMEMEFLNTKNF